MSEGQTKACIGIVVHMCTIRGWVRFGASFWARLFRHGLFGAILFGDGFFGAVGTHYPTIWKLIDALRKVRKGRDAYYEKLLAGTNPNPDPDQVLKFIKIC